MQKAEIEGLSNLRQSFYRNEVKANSEDNRSWERADICTHFRYTEAEIKRTNALLYLTGSNVAIK